MKVLVALFKLSSRSDNSNSNSRNEEEEKHELEKV
jgi:hypothetical protein